MTRATVRQTSALRKQRREHRVHVVATPTLRPAPMHPAERRIRAAGGPDDRACYSCGCGYIFEALVTTTVSCPHCATVQAW